MDSINDKDIMEVGNLQDEREFQAFLNGKPKGLLCVPFVVGEKKEKLLMADTFQFAKWVKKQGSIVIDVKECEGFQELRSNELWLPLVYIASDSSIQIYLNLVASFIYDWAKGHLKHDKDRVSLEAVYIDKKEQRAKKFTYKGSVEGLEKAIKKVDLNEFMKD